MWMDGKTEHNGVTVILCRHEKPANQDISGYGAGYAYLTGKLLCDYEGVSYPEHIFYSPVARARHTADMHELAMKVNDIIPPTKSYDAAFHEQASKQKVLEGFDDALTYAEASNMKTIEIVGHEPTLNFIGNHLGDYGKNLGYGAILVVKADSWDDIRQGKCIVDKFASSRDFALKALGNEQVEILDELMHYGNQTGRVQLSSDLTEREHKQAEKGTMWLGQVVSGQKPMSRYSPIEYHEVFDAYKAWVDMSMSALGINPNQEGFLYSELYQKLRKDNPEFAAFEQRLNDADNESYGVFEATAKLLSRKKGIKIKEPENLENMKDFPLYRDIVMAGEGRVLSGDKETKDESQKSYRITTEEQRKYDEVANIVRNFKDMHR